MVNGTTLVGSLRGCEQRHSPDDWTLSLSLRYPRPKLKLLGILGPTYCTGSSTVIVRDVFLHSELEEVSFRHQTQLRGAAIAAEVTRHAIELPGLLGLLHIAEEKQVMRALLDFPCTGQLMLLLPLMLNPLAACLRRRSLLLFF